MNKLPVSIWIVSGMTVACFIIGLVTGHIRQWYGLGGIGFILTLAVFAKWVTRNDPPEDDDFPE